VTDHAPIFFAFDKKDVTTACAFTGDEVMQAVSDQKVLFFIHWFILGYSSAPETGALSAMIGSEC
jgi:hypothetical protein